MSADSAPTTPDPTMWSGLLHSGLSGFVPTASVRRAAGGRPACPRRKAAVYGIPFDATNISQHRSQLRTRGIRDVSRMFLTYNATLGFDVVEALNPVDCGDCTDHVANAEKTFARAQADLEPNRRSRSPPGHPRRRPFGDDPRGARGVRALLRSGFVLIDTHLDTAMDVGGELLNHCCPITRAVEAGFDPAKIVLIGISGWMNPRTELAYCREKGITIIWLEEIWERGTGWAVQPRRRDRWRGRRRHLSVL